ncbi:MAG: ChaB family protein [Candidatus Portnoybacteria bacterium]|nr:ChaB family protein [Candidatus Portnoybacteria bacterium]
MIKLPYQSNKDLPARVREGMPEHAQSIFRNVFNSVMGQDGAEESNAFAQAYGALENAGYKQNTEGKWVKEGAKKSIDDIEWRREFDITKTDEDQRLVFGWLSVAKDSNGNSIVDLQDDIIDTEELEKAAIEYALESREAGQSHVKTTGIGKMVMSIVTTKEIQKAIGIPKGIVPEGWFIGYKIIDDETWDLVKSGDYKGFSIGGTGKRVPYYV